MRFVDTNVVLYAISSDADERPKADIARELLRSTDVGLSVQVLQEFYVQATRNNRSDRLTHDQASQLVESFLRFPIQAITSQVMLSALETRERYGISFWDAAIIEAARTLGCEVVLSEDLSDHQDYGGVRVENPFHGT